MDTLVSVGGSRADSLAGGNGLDYFWCDVEATEKLSDVNLIEALAGTAHRVGSFANGASRERLPGQFREDGRSQRLWVADLAALCERPSDVDADAGWGC